jgi:hypothetical protein
MPDEPVEGAVRNQEGPRPERPGQPLPEKGGVSADRGEERTVERYALIP